MNHHTTNLELSRQQKQQQKPALESSKADGFGAKAEALRAQRFGDLEMLERYEVMPDGAGVVGYYTNGRGQLCARGFRGRAVRPNFRNYFLSAASRDQFVADWIKAEAGVIEAKQKRKAEEKKPHGYQVGDVLYASWGWEQTNIDFYEVVAVRGAVVDIVEIRQDKVQTFSMQGTCTPRKGDHKGGVIKGKRPNGLGQIRLNSYSYARAWDGRPLAWSSYA